MYLNLNTNTNINHQNKSSILTQIQRRQWLKSLTSLSILATYGTALTLMATPVLAKTPVPNTAQKPSKSTNSSTQPHQPQTGHTMTQVKFTTNVGSFTLQLDAEKAPKTVANFLQYVREGHYAGTIFHRVISNFMIQGGGFAVGMKQKPTHAPVENEANNGLKNDLYTVAMARTSDPHSASAQFFINVKNNDFLNYSSPTAQGWGYAVFGKVVDGTSVVDKMKTVPTGNRGGHGDVPRDDIIIESAEIL